VTGPQAIVTAIYAWWLDRRGSWLREQIEVWLAELKPDSLLNQTRSVVGNHFLDCHYSVELKLSEDMTADPTINFMMDFITTQSPSRTRWSGWTREHALQFIRLQLAEDIGQIVKQTGWFDRNKVAISSEKRRLQAVTQVHRS
jgi:hypothetical protein